MAAAVPLESEAHPGLHHLSRRSCAGPGAVRVSCLRLRTLLPRRNRGVSCCAAVSQFGVKHSMLLGAERCRLTRIRTHSVSGRDPLSCICHLTSSCGRWGPAAAVDAVRGRPLAVAGATSRCPGLGPVDTRGWIPESGRPGTVGFAETDPALKPAEAGPRHRGRVDYAGSAVRAWGGRH